MQREGISVIVPHYNSSELLFKLLESINLESHFIEVIVIDDKSDIEEIKKIKESKFYNKIIFKENNYKKNAGTCRNIGIDISTREWIIFADADDFFVYNLEKIYGEIKNREEDIIYYKMISYYLNTLKEAERHIFYNNLLENALKDKTINSLEKIKYNWVSPCGKIIKSKIIKENKIYFDECLAANDVMFSLKLGNKIKKIGLEAKVLYCGTKGKNTLTTTKNYEIFNSRFEVLKKRNEYLEKIGKKEYIIPGFGFLIQSRRYGIKKFFEVLKYNLLHLKYIKNQKFWK